MSRFNIRLANFRVNISVLVTVIVILIKIILFHYLAFSSILVSSLWTDTLAFVKFYLPKISVSLLFTAILLSSKHRWVTTLLMFIFDIWCVCNLVYLEADNLLIDPQTILLIGNMEGVWNSILPFIHWYFLLFPLISICFTIFLYRYKLVGITLKERLSLLLLFLLLSVCDYTYDWSDRYGMATKQIAIVKGEKVHYSIKSLKYYLPFYNIIESTQSDTYIPYNIWSINYVKRNSILHYFCSMYVYEIFDEEVNPQSLLEENQDILESLSLSQSPVKSNLIIIFVESLESWAIKQPIAENNIMPNLQNFIDHYSSNILRCDSIEVQIKHGASGDGQMILMTGLLPISRGAACAVYQGNVFPNFAHFYKGSTIIAPSNAWYQDVMTKRYQFKELIIPSNKVYDDTLTFSTLINVLDTISQPFCITGITMKSHLPFTYNETKELHFPSFVPNDLDSYLNCLHYTDKELGKIFRELKQDSLLRNTTIVITGDHDIFRSRMENFVPVLSDLNVQVTSKSFVPLIIYSPSIKHHIQVSSINYQMDIYPTILELIGKSDYPWQGFGQSLISNYRKREVINQDSLYHVSESLFSVDYFKQFEDILN